MLLVVDNAAGELMTGAFANVRLDAAEPGSRDPRAGERADLRPERPACRDGRAPTTGWCSSTITISRDLGREVEIATGLDPEDRVIESPPDGVADGDQVRIATKPGAGNAAENAPKRQPKD